MSPGYEVGMRHECGIPAVLALTAIAVGLWCCPVRAHAAKMDGPAPFGAQQSDRLHTVVVTAEHWHEKLQAVPIAVTALTADALRQSGIESTLGLQQAIPDFVMTTNATMGQIYLRGVGTDIINEGTDPSIAVYQDGVYQARAADSIAELYDVKRVEVVLGPQGTLYGLNAAAGAIRIITNDPTDRFQADASAQFGNYDHVRTTAMANLPVSRRVALRVAGFYDYHEGFSQYQYIVGKRDDGVDAWGARAKLSIRPTRNVVFILTGEHTDDRSTRNMAPVVDPSLFSPAIDVFGAKPYVNPRDAQNNLADAADVTQSKIYGTLVWEGNDVELKSLTSYEPTVNNISQLDVDATDINFLWDSLYERSDAFTQKLQLRSTAHRALHWVVGLFYLHEAASQIFPIRVNIPVIPGPKPDALMSYDTAIFTHAYAAYGQTSYRIDKIRLTAGVRYNYERKKSGFHEAIIDPYNLLSPSGSAMVTNPQSRGWGAWTPRFVIGYSVRRDVMMYVSASRGFKSGGMNLEGSGEVFQPETLWDYEGGIKATWFDDRLRTNLDAFYYDYRNLQVSVFNGAASVVTNVPKSRMRGFEANLTGLPMPDLQLDLHLALLDARIGRFSTLNPNTGLVQNVSNNTLPRAPKTALTAGVQYTVPWVHTGRLTMRADMKYQSRIYFTYWDSPGVDQGGYSLFNTRLSYRIGNGSWSVALYGNNLSNKLYRASVVQSQSQIGTLLFWGPPRTFGVEFRWRHVRGE